MEMCFNSNIYSEGSFKKIYRVSLGFGQERGKMWRWNEKYKNEKK